MKKSIFDRKLNNPKFRKTYEKIAEKLSIGEEIAELRHKHKMTQLELAKKVRTSRSAIARYESGEYTHYNLNTLSRIAKALNVKLNVSLIAL